MLTPKVFSSSAMISIARSESAPRSSKRVCDPIWSSSTSMISAMSVRIFATCASSSVMDPPLAPPSADGSFGSRAEVLSAVHPDDVAGDPRGRRPAHERDGLGHVLGSGQATVGVDLPRALHDALVPRDLPEGGCQRDPRPDRVDGHAASGQLEGELAPVGLEGGLGSGARPAAGRGLAA